MSANGSPLGRDSESHKTNVSTERINSAAISGHNISTVCTATLVSGSLAANALWTADPNCVPEGWQLCEPPTPTGWHRLERKRS